jgi:hypothetical protein
MLELGCYYYNIKFRECKTHAQKKLYFDLAAECFKKAAKLGDEISVKNLFLIYNNLKDTFNTSKYRIQFMRMNPDLIQKDTRYQILLQTGIWPSNFEKRHNEDMELRFVYMLSLADSKDVRLPKEIILLIAGYLYVV